MTRYHVTSKKASKVECGTAPNKMRTKRLINKVMLLRSPKDNVLQSLTTKFIKSVDRSASPAKMVKNVVKFGTALLYCVLLGAKLLQQGVSPECLFEDYIPTWSDRIAVKCASSMYKVWHVLRLDLESFIWGIILDNPKVKELNQAKHNTDAINRYDECNANKPTIY